jgi:hypothetical protein
VVSIAALDSVCHAGRLRGVGECLQGYFYKELWVKQNRFNSSSIIRHLAVLGWLVPAALGLATLVPQQSFAQG